MRYFLPAIFLLLSTAGAAPLEKMHGEYVGTVQRVHGYPGEQGGRCILSVSVGDHFVTFAINEIEVKMDRRSVERAIASGEKEVKLTRYLGERTFEMAMLFVRHGRLRGVMVAQTDAGGYNNPANWRRIVCGQISPL